MERSHFVLVHGACHGSWCWYKVTTLLESQGHKVTALDMAACGVNLKQDHEVRSMSDYIEPLVEFMCSLPPQERVVLVGHSLGGFGISIAMEMFCHKISAAVFVSAFLISPQFSFTSVLDEYNRIRDSYMDSTYGFDNGPNNQPTSQLFGRNLLSTKLYQLSPAEDLTLAMSLIRPAIVAASQEEAAVLTKNFGSVRRVYVVCDQDNLIKEDFQRWMIERNEPDEVKFIVVSDHMPMFSKPQELCTCLLEVASKYK